MHNSPNSNVKLKYLSSGRNSLIAVVNCGGQKATPPAFFETFSRRGRGFSRRGRTPSTPRQIEPWLFPYCRPKQVGRLHLGDVPSKTAGKATHTLQCSWISMTAWWQHVVSARTAAITSSVGRSLEGYSSKAQQRS